MTGVGNAPVNLSPIKLQDDFTILPFVFQHRVTARGAFVYFGQKKWRKVLLEPRSFLGYPGKVKVDAISTGGSLKAMEKPVEKAGGTVAGRMAVLAEGAAAERNDIRFLAPLPVFNADGSVK